MTPAGLLGIIGTLFAIVALLAVAAVYARATYAKARIDTLNQEIAEGIRRHTQVKDELSETVARLKVCEAKVVALNELVTQRAQLDAMKDTISMLQRALDINTSMLERLLERPN